ncbi:MAG: ABC transporter permease, partial [Candidatus Woesearchaeota archaeon]
DDRGIVIGWRLAKERFSRELFVGNSRDINDRRYTILGILEEEGQQGTDFGIFAPLDIGREIVGDNSAVTGFQVRVADGFDFDVVKDRVKTTLERSRGREDFGITTPEEIRNQIGTFLQVVDIVVLSIALISLFVASLGIINSLYTSVMQRTREIGTMKAIGAKNSQILLLFLLESAILGFIGGVLGALVGFVLSIGFIVSINALGIFQLPVSFDFALGIGAIIFSVLLGIFSGLLPAYKASKLKPVDALRHE